MLDVKDEAFAAVRPGSGTIGTEEFEQLLARAGRTNGPALLFDAWFARRINADTLAATIGAVWAHAEYPDRALTRDYWRELFAAAGYTSDRVRAEQPADAVELWRGTVHQRRRDWSWTTDRAVAERFAFAGVRGRPTGSLYRLLAPPRALLCANTDRGESEFVVDTRGLRISAVAAQ